MSRKYRTFLITTVLIVLVSALTVFIQSEELVEPEEIKSNLVESSDISSGEELALSEDVNFPSPVIQLQQSVVHGLIEVEKTEIPLLRGDLEEFSNNNIDKQYPPTFELAALKQRLADLQSLNP
ncbi:hypothetical protein AB6E04_00905 [Vibrio amylolyticus]|uniref:hypothetical protein n=1 Tax=Vibrio amylolyticus TaxID=2847292 RepID=UPI00354E0937